MQDQPKRNKFPSAADHLFFFPLLYSTSFCRSDPQLLLAFLWILDLIHSACSGPHPFVCFCNNNSNLRLLTLTILSPPSPEFYCSSCNFPNIFFKLNCAFKKYLLHIPVFVGYMVFHIKALQCTRQSIYNVL